MRNSRLIFNTLVLSTMAFVALCLIQANVFAFAWHLRYGFHREFNGIRFSVPLFYEETKGAAMNQFSILALPSPLHKSSSYISVSFRPWTADKPLQPLSRIEARAIGMRFSSERTASFASRSGKCVEYLENQMRLPPYSNTSSGLLWITCRFGDEFEANFDGTQSAVQEFYDFIASAKEVSR